MDRTTTGALGCLLAAAILASCGGHDAVTNEIERATAATKTPAHLGNVRWKLLQQVYADRGHEPLWIGAGRPNERGRALVETLCQAEREGLRAGDYDLGGLRRALERTYGGGTDPGPAMLAALDLRLTALFLDYGADLLVGRLDPRAVDDGWYIKARRSSADSTLRAAARAADVGRMLAPLRPQQPEYQALVDALARYRTLAATSDSAARRVQQIELNLERYRWLPAAFGERYLLVNIPEYQLHAYDGGKRAFTMRVIVGDEYDNATPVFADSMTHIVFHPHWNVPSSILAQEMLPKLREDDGYLTRNNYEVVHAKHGTPIDPGEIDWDDVDTMKLEFRVRQKPGPANALGLVKFMFPNQFSIYLHDTPADELFERPKRTLSHGCVRVEDPVKLAGFVLDGQGDWDGDKIRQAMAADTAGPAASPERTVTLERPVPVYIVYLTAVVRDGMVHFHDDPYHKDRQAIARLRPARPRDRTICETLTKLVGA